MEQTVITDDGCRLWAVRVGQGDPVVFCHGGPGLWETLGEVAQMLSSVATVYRWDQRGCGRSERLGPYSMARSVADLDAVRRHFGLLRMTVLGHSWGAQLALQYALAYPERITRLIYVSGTGIDPESTWHSAYERNLRTRLGEGLERWQELKRRERTPREDREFAVLQWSVDFVDRTLALSHAEQMATPWLGVNFECNRVLNAETKRSLEGNTLTSVCRTLDVPTLIVDGSEDIRPRWAVDSLQDALPQVSRVTLQGAGHLPWTEDPHGFRSAVAGFLTTDV
ncbi:MULTISPECIES: alpha/beta fold hydrolase [Streptosporangium]|uniref:Proline iminopeptidase n=1 Tax=Streptosporangium brasiliense TaxID=47480 RepID=A0ABT9R416_9ACTN|nr:alpha/beta hydrolase [Streptosporangium brasiliense]MDP9863918.1 proline iminopeptidase [Streptosporangium brasiliense]